MPRKPASENVFCLCQLLNILANLFLHTGEHVDPDQTAPLIWVQPVQKWLLKSQADDKADDNCCDWQFKD